MVVLVFPSKNTKANFFCWLKFVFSLVLEYLRGIFAFLVIPDTRTRVPEFQACQSGNTRARPCPRPQYPSLPDTRKKSTRPITIVLFIFWTRLNLQKNFPGMTFLASKITNKVISRSLVPSENQNKTKSENLIKVNKIRNLTNDKKLDFWKSRHFNNSYEKWSGLTRQQPRRGGLKCASKQPSSPWPRTSRRGHRRPPAWRWTSSWAAVGQIYQVKVTDSDFPAWRGQFLKASGLILLIHLGSKERWALVFVSLATREEDTSLFRTLITTAGSIK